ncbi:MAG TPA: hypothetical protein PKN96_07535 [Flavobacterium sp.]|uniref:hypothetical protein n=1 Tax=Flavobacterium sp. TaxID=239 RepID=UPI002D1A7C78|nr:hypothetical protein [Flavobacterium sp.]HNP33129.1 hypothetical protein [Flavobacterium sp.]
MKKFLIYLAAFSVLFLIYDRLFLFFIYASPSKESDKRLELVLNGKINKDIIVMGSSSGARDIIASQLEKETKQTVYNLSYPGSNIEFHEFLLRSLLTFNSTPKMVILTLDGPNEVLPDSMLTFRLDRLYPLIKYDYINKELIDRNEKNAILSKLFVLHKMTKANFDLRQKKFTALDTVFSDGSMPISFQKENVNWNEKLEDTIYQLQKESKVKIKCLQKIVTVCKQHNIKLLLVFPPNFREITPMFEKRMLQIAGKNSWFYEYDASNKIYTNKDYYFDLNHLKRNGAVIFTHEIADYLSKQNSLQTSNLQAGKSN